MTEKRTAPESDSGLELRNVACIRGERCLYRGLNLRAEPGAILRLAGPNGAGKTTLMRIIAGLLQPETGEVLWNGMPAKELGGDFRASLLYIGHLNGVKEELSALENLQVNAKLFSRKASRKDCLAALQAVGLAGFEEVPVRFLSQGQHRRAALSRLYLSEDIPVWVLDEPFTALDVAGVTSLCRLIERHSAAGGITVMTTHQASDLASDHYAEIDVSAFVPKKRKTAAEKEASHA